MNPVAKINPIANPVSVPDSFWKETIIINDIKCHRHPNGGGWVAETAKVEPSAFVGLNAMVYGHAQVRNNAQVYGNAQVFGNARVYGDAWVYDNAMVYEYAQVYGNAQVYGFAQVYGDAKVFEKARVFDCACVHGYAWVSGNARLYGFALVHEYAQVYGDAKVYDNAKVCGNALVCGPMVMRGEDAWITSRSVKNRQVDTNVEPEKDIVDFSPNETLNINDPYKKSELYDCLLDKIEAENLTPDMVYCLYDIVQGQTICKFNLYGNIRLDRADSTGYAFMNMDTKRIVFSGHLGENCGIMEYNALSSTMTEIDPNKAVYNTPEVFLASF